MIIFGGEINIEYIDTTGLLHNTTITGSGGTTIASPTSENTEYLCSDGVDNGIELTPVATQATNVLEADTDGDGYEDNLDPCALDALNLCLGQPNNTADSDNDGVIDSLDNCLRVSNADQADGDGNGTSL